MNEIICGVLYIIGWTGGLVFFYWYCIMLFTKKGERFRQWLKDEFDL